MPRWLTEINVSMFQRLHWNQSKRFLPPSHSPMHSATGTQTFPKSKLGGWKHTTAFHISSKTNRHQALKHLGKYCCYWKRSVIGKRWGRWTFRNWGDISLSPASRETTQTNKPPKHYRKTRNIPNGSNKEEIYPKGQCHHKGPSLNKKRFELAGFELVDLKAKVVRLGIMEIERQINSLIGLLAVTMIWQQISLTNRLTHQSTTLINKRT